MHPILSDLHRIMKITWDMHAEAADRRYQMIDLERELFLSTLMHQKVLRVTDEETQHQRKKIHEGIFLSFLVVTTPNV